MPHVVCKCTVQFAQIWLKVCPVLEMSWSLKGNYIKRYFFHYITKSKTTFSKFKDLKKTTFTHRFKCYFPENPTLLWKPQFLYKSQPTQLGIFKLNYRNSVELSIQLVSKFSQPTSSEFLYQFDLVNITFCWRIRFTSKSKNRQLHQYKL